MRRLLSEWEPLVALAIAVTMIVGLLTTAEVGLPRRLESLTLDARFRLRPANLAPTPIVIVGIDDASIAEIGRWPWSRALFARLLDRLAAAGAKVVAFDLLFTEPQPSPLAAERDAIEAAMGSLLENRDLAERTAFEAAISAAERNSSPDVALARAIASHDAVIVPFAVEFRQGAGAVKPPPLPAVLQKAAYERVRGTDPDHLPEVSALRMPIAPIAESGSLAHVTVVPDGAGAYRYDYPVLRYDDSYLPSLSLECVRSFFGVARANVVVDIGRGIDVGPLHVPLDEGMRSLVNYYPRGSFRSVSFADALSGRAAAETFSDKIVLVGASAAGVGEVFPSPYTPVLPGVERHATLIANMLQRDFLRRDESALVLDGLMILIGGLCVGVFSRWGALGSTAASLAMLGGLTLSDYEAFVRYGVWLNFTFPAANIAAAFAGIVGAKYTIRWRRERWIRFAFSRYLHPEVVDELCRSQMPLRLGGEERELTVLFLDVRDFSGLAENLTAPELVSTMNTFFTAMTTGIQAHRGMVDKYIGDSLMAVFGAPLPDTDHATHACRAAIQMRAALESLNARGRAEGRPRLEMRIGINTGRMTIGNFGAEQRFDYTVMGDEVNVASRLEGACKGLGADILVSAATRRRPAIG